MDEKLAHYVILAVKIVPVPSIALQILVMFYVMEYAVAPGCPRALVLTPCVP